MKRDQIKSELEAHLAKTGFRHGVNCIWQPNLAQLILMVEGNVETFKLKSGMSRRAFAYEMGVIAGLARAYGVKPAVAAKANGVARPKAEANQIPA
jgi:hypothetical protein